MDTQKDACNALYDAIESNCLSQEQVESLLARGCAPEFRSLAGILQDAADMGKEQAYEAGSAVLIQQMNAATAAADERAIQVMREEAAKYNLIGRIEQRIKERT